MPAEHLSGAAAASMHACPLGHGVHTRDAVALLYVPAPHAEHVCDAPALKKPARHATGADEAGSRHAYPAGHGAHCVAAP